MNGYGLFMTIVYFGARWDAPLLDRAIEGETPVGATCYWCDEPIVRGDRGFIEAALRPVNDELTVGVTHVHAECRLDEFCGHNVGLCRCTGVELSRARARQVWACYFDEEGNSLWRANAPTPTPSDPAA